MAGGKWFHRRTQSVSSRVADETCSRDRECGAASYLCRRRAAVFGRHSWFLLLGLGLLLGYLAADGQR
jgi:hypothetical protein